MGGGLLPPWTACSAQHRGPSRGNHDATRLGRTPIEGAAAEVEPVDRDEILVEATL